MRTIKEPISERRRDQDEKISDLLGRLAANSAELVRDEFELARQEMSENARKLRGGIIALTLGVTIASIALLVLVAAGVVGLGYVVGFAQSALIIGVFLSAVAAAITSSGIRRIRRTSLKPEQTIETFEENKAWLKPLK